MSQGISQGIYTEAERVKLIELEYANMAQLVEGLGEGKKAAMLKLCREAAFMAVTLEETRQIINRDGITEVYQNGANQHGVKKSAAVEIYDKMMNTYAKVIAQIRKDLPDEGDDAGNELLEFLRAGRDLRSPHAQNE